MLYVLLLRFGPLQPFKWQAEWEANYCFAACSIAFRMVSLRVVDS